MKQILLSSLGLILCVSVMLFSGCSKGEVDISSTRSSATTLEAPVRLTVKGKPLNAAKKERFPSPAVFDVDGDGQAELVIGSLMGSVGVHENLNTSGTGDPDWASQKPLKDSEGKSIRTSNW